MYRTFIYSLLLSIFGLIDSNLCAERFSGYYNFQYVEESGKILLDVPEERIGEPFLYVTSLAAGVGSNDLGLDRGQLGDQKVVYWYRAGNKLLLIQDNLKYRAISDNKAEQKAVHEAFAESVIYGFVIINAIDGGLQVDMTNFLMRDAHHISSKLRKQKEGEYKLDKTRSTIYKEGLFSFPNNSEFESILTFVGSPKGKHIRSVSPDPYLVSTRQHHSFIALPDDDYEPRVFYPESGYFYTEYYDYATPIEEPLVKKFINRHRLKKKYPDQETSEAVDPIIYYLDPGCPEPIKSALLEGASWWNQAFEAAGYIDAFQIRELPEGAHPLDVRYNVIQWVHRSTRGWSYGASIKDPRTGEIIKGHVSLGSLRVRQDFMIAQGLISKSDKVSRDRMKAMALDRLRQLSAHEVGHTIGLAHNFAASTDNRSSVMDYPHPLIMAGEGGALDFSDAYDQKIGEWDKRAIIYGYKELDTENEKAELQMMMENNRQDGFRYITDKDARPLGGMHPDAHLWDNGRDIIGELDRLMTLRAYTMENLTGDALMDGQPYSELEKILVPVYLMHRYQMEGVSKMIGGVNYSYSLKSDKSDQKQWTVINKASQEKALSAMLNCLKVENLTIPQRLLDQIPPPAYGYARDRETFKGNTGEMFDPMAVMEATANQVMSMLLHPQRLTRIDQQSLWSVKEYLGEVKNFLDQQKAKDDKIGTLLYSLFLNQLIKLSGDEGTSNLISLEVNSFLLQLTGKISDFDIQLLLQKFLDNPKDYQIPNMPKLPPGSPIGCY